MPIDCNASYVDASMACDEGRVLVCLRDTDGTAYFDKFDIGGGTANGVTPPVTGFISSNNPPPYTQDYNVANEPANFQCFYIPYNLVNQTTDALILQATDANDVPVGNACTLAFNIDCNTNCTDTFTCPNAPVQLTAAAGQDFCLVRSAVGIPDQTGNTCTVSGWVLSNSTSFQTSGNCLITVLGSALPAVGQSFTIEADVFCCGTAQAINCVLAEVTVVEAGDPCLDCTQFQVQNVSSNVLTPGETLTFDTSYGGPLNTDWSPRIKDGSGNQIGEAVFQSVANGFVSWSWQVPAGCVSAEYVVCARSALQGASCDDCELFMITLDCDSTGTCPDPVIDQCVNGQVILQAGVATTLSVSGCDCADTITWSSPNSQLSFNPVNGASTQVTSQQTGSFTIEVECCTTGGGA